MLFKIIMLGCAESFRIFHNYLFDFGSALQERANPDVCPQDYREVTRGRHTMNKKEDDGQMNFFWKFLANCFKAEGWKTVCKQLRDFWYR